MLIKRSATTKWIGRISLTGALVADNSILLWLDDKLYLVRTHMVLCKSKFKKRFPVAAYMCRLKMSLG